MLLGAHSVQTAAEMKQRGYPFNQATYEALITRSIDLGGSANAASVLWKEMQENGFVKPSAASIAALIDVNFREKHYDVARKHVTWLLSAGMQPSALTLLQAFAIEDMAGEKKRASELLTALKLSPHWNTLLGALSEANRNPIEAPSKDTKTTGVSKAKKVTKKRMEPANKARKNSSY